MKISVIVPVYNTEKYLNRCVDSILAQTFSDFELLLIDDGSTDGSGKICDEYAAKDKRVKVFHQQNGGVSRARNLGIDNATGEYISFIDSDDYIRPEMYEKLIDITEKYQVDLITSDFIQNGKELKNNVPSERIIFKEEIHNKVLPLFTVNGSLATFEFKTKLYKKRTIFNSGIKFYEGFAFQEDTMFLINVYANISSMYYLPETFYIYESLPTGLYSAYRKTDGKNFVKARGIMLSLIKKYDIPADILNFNVGYLYNISWFTYRTLRLNNKKEKDALINEVIFSEQTKAACKYLKDNAASFDKRIAKAIYKGKKKKAIFLIKFVYSGKAAKLQKLVAKLKGKK